MLIVGIILLTGESYARADETLWSERLLEEAPHALREVRTRQRDSEFLLVDRFHWVKENLTRVDTTEFRCVESNGRFEKYIRIVDGVESEEGLVGGHLIKKEEHVCVTPKSTFHVSRSLNANEAWQVDSVAQDRSIADDFASRRLIGTTMCQLYLDRGEDVISDASFRVQKCAFDKSTKKLTVDFCVQKNKRMGMALRDGQMTLLPENGWPVVESLLRIEFADGEAWVSTTCKYEIGPDGQTKILSAHIETRETRDGLPLLTRDQTYSYEEGEPLKPEVCRLASYAIRNRN